MEKGNPSLKWLKRIMVFLRSFVLENNQVRINSYDLLQIEILFFFLRKNLIIGNIRRHYKYFFIGGKDSDDS